MARVIEITISPQGETTIQTRGYTGGDCLEASRFLEKALGQIQSERKTAEFYQDNSTEQRIEQKPV